MSVFEGQTEGQEEQKSFLETLVETKGEQWKDPEVIAKGKIEADSYIESLERQIKELNEDRERGAKVDELLKEIRGKTAATTEATSEKDSGTPNSDTKNDEGEVDLESLVEKKLEERQQKATVAQNIKLVEDTLKETFGTEAASAVQTKASELGVSLSHLQTIAQESPTAFLKLMEVAPTKKGVNTTQGSFNTSLSNTSSEKQDWSYYQEMRKKNPSMYYSSSVQRQLMQKQAEARAKGGSFIPR